MKKLTEPIKRALCIGFAYGSLFAVFFSGLFYFIIYETIVSIIKFLKK